MTPQTLADWYGAQGASVALTAWTSAVSSCLFLGLALVLMVDYMREDKANQFQRVLVGWFAALSALSGLLSLADLSGVWGQLLWLADGIRLARTVTVACALASIILRVRHLGNIVQETRQREDEDVVYGILHRLRAQARHHAAQ